MTAAPRIVHRDDRLAVIDKPAGLVVHPAPGHRGPTLVDVLGDLLGGGEPERPGIVHRLDRDTSGLMLIARDDEAHRRLAAMIKGREVAREYLALVEGRPRSRAGTIDAPLGRDHRAPERRAVRGRGARDARTHFTVLEVLPADALVEARLETGRTHQVRAHFAAIGHPMTTMVGAGLSGSSSPSSATWFQLVSPSSQVCSTGKERVSPAASSGRRIESSMVSRYPSSTGVIAV